MRGPWPTPARDGIRATVIATALKYEMWGHRKIAWLCLHEHGLQIAEATCLRILREAGLTLPVDYAREARDLAGARREAFLDPPTRRNQVWQMDFFELETAGGGTWRSGDVVDYWAKVVLAGPVTKTQTHRDAIASVMAAIEEAERLLGRPLIEDLIDPDGTIHPIYLVTDNGPCFKADKFARFIDSRPELTHIRTRKKSPETNGVIERYHGSIKIECLWRHLPADGLEMTDQVDAFRRLYNDVRPHESLDGQRPTPTYLAAPAARTIPDPDPDPENEPSTSLTDLVQTRQVERIS